MILNGVCYKLARPFIFIFLITISNSKTVAQGEKVIDLMHSKWSKKWPQNMAFEQNVYFYNNAEIVKEEIWQEVISSPKKLHIRFNGFDTGNGVIFNNDSIYHFKNNTISAIENRVHHLLLLGFDVYFLNPNETKEKLRNLGFDLSLTCNTVLGNDKIIVVGTNDIDHKNKSQFWIDKENLYLRKVRLINDAEVSEIDFTNYTKINGHPVATEIIFKKNDEIVMIEKYFNISFPQQVNETIFDQNKFKTIRW